MDASHGRLVLDSKEQVMIDAPPAIVRQDQLITQSEVMNQYCNYHYGLCPLRHSSEQLGRYADAAKQFGFITIAEGFEKLVGWAEREEEKERDHEMAEHEAHVDHLRKDYR
jgi:hypothetical protein